ncbi:hypothetical protein BKA67DRAFT_657957 [Truncatella angustata]|uniref:Uncharacterized protein n=1 Tax=Truncatella angustata TaxID=152316 RepID=A0A9P8UQ47_9PEZI|nr:uncharacterized protein BKA67DRAFT_657957 [Truncatella angustata]KAH6656066.1 hypothetical protein BKA67DRAFT_657957 [Truncatella angustata]
MAALTTAQADLPSTTLGITASTAGDILLPKSTSSVLVPTAETLRSPTPTATTTERASASTIDVNSPLSTPSTGSELLNSQGNGGGTVGGPSWVPFPNPVPVGGGSAGDGIKGDIYQDGYREGYDDGCHSSDLRSDPSESDSKFIEGYRKGRAAGILECRPLNDNFGGGAGSPDSGAWATGRRVSDAISHVGNNGRIWNTLVFLISLWLVALVLL